MGSGGGPADLRRGRVRAGAAHGRRPPGPNGLAAGQSMHRIGWIRGEWHYDSNLSGIERALSGTHVYNIERGGTAWGAFLPHRMPSVPAGPRPAINSNGR